MSNNLYVSHIVKPETPETNGIRQWMFYLQKGSSPKTKTFHHCLNIHEEFSAETIEEGAIKLEKPIKFKRGQWVWEFKENLYLGDSYDIPNQAKKIIFKTTPN